MLVLGIESSCDETGLALYHSEKGLVAEVLHSQISLHRPYGGVVPELASRDHIRRTVPLIRELFTNASCTLKDLDGIAYTAGPGLAGALLVGAALARSMGMALAIPTVGIHHMEGHLLAPMLADPAPSYPFLALLVSGGHTQLVQVDGLGAYRLLGESVDDAAGEAFDKVAKMLNLPYPGGPELARLALKGRPGRFEFTRPMLNRPGLDFSFSGLKTAVLTALQDVEAVGEVTEQDKADLAYEFQNTVVDTLTVKCRRALRQSGLDSLVVAGGVSANTALRKSLHEMVKAENVHLYFPPLAYCTDNGAMIAYAGCQRLLAGEADDLTIKAQPRWNLSSLSVPTE